MITPRKTDTRTDLLGRHANWIYAAVEAAAADGYILVLKDGWMVDLEDEVTGRGTPVTGVMTNED